MPSPPLLASADGVGLGVVPLHPGRSCLPLQTLHTWVGTSQRFFTYQKGKRWKEGGKTNYFLFGSSGTAEAQGTVGEGGASLCLNHYAKKTKKQNKQSSLPYVLWEAGLLPDSRFSLGLGRRPKLGDVSCSLRGGLVKISKEAWVLQGPWPLD